MKLGTYLLAALLLASCGKQEAAHNTPSSSSSTTTAQSTTSAQTKVNISGQVFVVTQGRENIKLALVEVSAIPEKDIIQHLEAKHKNGLEQKKVLMHELESAKKEANAASAASERASNEWSKAHDNELDAIRSDGNYSAAEKERKEANNRWSKLSDVAWEKNNNQKKLKSKFYSFDSAEYYLEGLPTPIGISKTDADGKFTLSLPPGKYAIAATSSRKVVGNKESYYWLVWVDTSSPNQSLMLSNDNLFETKCKECAYSKLQLTENELAAIEGKIKEKASEEGKIKEKINKDGKNKEKTSSKADDAELDKLQPNWREIVNSAEFQRWLKEPPAINNFDSLSAKKRSEIIDNHGPLAK